MTGTAHAGLAVLAAVFVYGVLLVRYAVTAGTPRARRLRRVEEYVPAFLVVPARELACPGCGTTIHTSTAGGPR